MTAVGVGCSESARASAAFSAVLGWRVLIVVVSKGDPPAVIAAIA